MSRLSLLASSALLLISMAAQSYAENRALILDGVNDGVVVSNPTAALQLTTQNTFMAWFRITNSLGSEPRVLLTKFELTNRIAYIIRYYPALGQWEMDYGDANRFYSTPVFYTNDAWRHVAFSHNGVSGQWYLDGAINSNSVNGYLHRLGTSAFFVGRAYDTNSATATWRGWVDLVSVWSRSLTSDEVILYKNKRLQGNESGLALYWDFDGGTALDSTTNGNNGVFVDNATTTTEPGVTNDAALALQFSFPTWPATTYQLQYVTNIVETNWINTGSPITGDSVTNYLYDFVVDPTKFYRIYAY